MDWTTPGNSTLTGPTNMPVAAFNEGCNGGVCIPQGGTTQQLDSLGDRLMYRLAYRNLGSRESLVVNHSVTAGSVVGLRWYEIRSPGGTPTVYQQGTFAPSDGNYRWMGSIAMDQSGDVALGYNVSGSNMHPAIRYTGRVPSDPLGAMEAESNILQGAGSQTGGLTRWGDYSSMSIDPVDDCTFWYVNQYIPSSGAFNWATHIYSFKFASCGPTAAPAAPAGLVATPGNAQVSLSWNSSSGAATYNVLRSTTSGGPYSMIATDVASTSLTNTGLTNGTAYYYVVQAVNSAGTSSNSNQAGATPVCSLPGVPAGLSATPGNALVSLSWAAASGATSYNVKRSTTSGSGYATIANVTSTSYTNIGLTNGTTYYYVVSAACSCGEGAASAHCAGGPDRAPGVASHERQEDKFTLDPVHEFGRIAEQSLSLDHERWDVRARRHGVRDYLILGRIPQQRSNLLLRGDGGERQRNERVLEPSVCQGEVAGPATHLRIVSLPARAVSAPR